MGLDPDVTRAELQAIAFGRAASEAQRAEAMARLAALEPPVVVDEPTLAPIEDPEPRPAPSPRRRFALVALVVVVAVAAVAAVGIVRKQQDPFAAFERAPTSADVAPAAASFGYDPQYVRLLGSHANYQVWGYRGPVTAEMGWTRDEMPAIWICLFVTSGTSGNSSSCTDDKEFALHGLHTGQLDLFTDKDGGAHVVEYTWGPTSPLTPHFKTIPQPPTLDEVFDRAPTDKDLDGRAYLLSESTAVSESARWVGDYHDVRIWIYRTDPDSVCTMAADVKSGLGRVEAACVPDAEFRASGMTLDWPVESVQLELSPDLTVSVSVSAVR